MQKIEVVDIQTGKTYSWVSHEEVVLQEGTIENIVVQGINGATEIEAKIVRCEYID